MSTRYVAPDSAESLLTTELNSLANDGGATGSAVSNDGSGEREPLGSIEVFIAAQGSARGSGASIDIYFLESNDDTNYTDAACQSNNYSVSISLDAATTARYVIKHGVPLPPVGFKPRVVNKTGQALAASGNTVKIRRYGYEDAAT